MEKNQYDLCASVLDQLNDAGVLEGVVIARRNREARRTQMDELIERFNKNGVRYLLIGGQAVRRSDLKGCPE